MPAVRTDQKAYFSDESRKGPQISGSDKETDTKQKIRGLSNRPLFQFKTAEKCAPTISRLPLSASTKNQQPEVREQITQLKPDSSGASHLLNP